MSDPITRRAEQLLICEPESFISLERLYRTLLQEGMTLHVDRQTFRRLLESDPAFEIFNWLGEALLADQMKTLEGLEILELFDGPWVLLAARKSFPLEVLQDLAHHLHRLNEILERAWRHLPNLPGTEKTRAGLIDMLLLSDLLERQIRGSVLVALNEQRSPEIRDLEDHRS
ncbi:MAG: hypothetical protein ACLFU8_11940 [Anaerolineales bacterium]